MADDILIGDTPKAQRRKGRLADFKTKGRLWKHSTLADIDGLPGSDSLSDMFLVTLVRNPWDRLVSYYSWARMQTFDHPAVRAAKSLNFSNFVYEEGVSRSLANSPVRYYLTDTDGKEWPALCARLEHLESDLEPLWSHLGFKLDVPMLNPSVRQGDYRDNYDATLASHVGELLAEDIERFGYEF